jgi:hypothetical protein
MVKKFVSIASVLVVLSLAGCSLFNDSGLVGKWVQKSYGVTVLTFNFGSDGTLVQSSLGIAVSYKYTASNGSGQYWLAIAPDVKSSFTYSITNNILTWVANGTTLTLSRE